MHQFHRNRLTLSHLVSNHVVFHLERANGNLTNNDEAGWFIQASKTYLRKIDGQLSYPQTRRRPAIRNRDYSCCFIQFKSICSKPWETTSQQTIHVLLLASHFKIEQF